MRTMRQPGDHPWLGEEFAPHNYLIAEQGVFGADRLPVSDALFHLKQSLSIFTEHVRNQDVELWSGIEEDDYRSLLAVMQRSVNALESHEPDSDEWQLQLTLCRRMGLLLLSFLYDAEPEHTIEPPDSRLMAHIIFPLKTI